MTRVTQLISEQKRLKDGEGNMLGQGKVRWRRGMWRGGGITFSKQGVPVFTNVPSSIPIKVTRMFYDFNSFTNFSLEMVFFSGNDSGFFKAYVMVCFSYMLSKS